jgi:hypothetical protein
MIYLDNDPTKPFIYIGIIFYTFCVKLNKMKYLLIENNNSKYEDFGIKLDQMNLDQMNLNTLIMNALQFHTNYLIDLTEEEMEIFNSDSKQVYIPSEMSLIKFIKASKDITNLKSEDFGSYTVKSNTEKIRRHIKWIDKTYLFRFLYRFKKMSKKLNNKEIIDVFKSIESENNLNLILFNIQKKIKSSSN